MCACMHVCVCVCVRVCCVCVCVCVVCVFVCCVCVCVCVLCVCVCHSAYVRTNRLTHTHTICTAVCQGWGEMADVPLHVYIRTCVHT